MTAHERRGDRLEPQGGRGHSSAKPQARNGGEKDKQGEMGARPKALARLPDLDIDDLDRVIDSDPPVGGKRPLTQRISTVALIGVGALFIMVAVQPYMGKSDRGMQPPAPSAPAAPAWDAMAAKKNTPPVAPGQQAQSLPPIPVSIPALPPSIPSVPDGIQGPAAPAGAPTGIPVPSFNKQSQAMPGSESAPGLAEVSSSQPVARSEMADPRTAQLAPPPAVSPSAPYAASNGYQPVVSQPGYYAANGQMVPNQAMTLAPSANVPAGYAAYPQAASAVNPATGFAGSANTPASLTADAMSTEPGVARLQGVIEKSTQRPSYDSSRSSLR